MLNGTLSRSKILKALRTWSPKESGSFRPDRAQWFIKHEGKLFPSKAIVGKASGLSASRFSGGLARLGKMLKRLGFEMVKVVALVACSFLKGSEAAPAGDLYKGDFFKKARALIGKLGLPWAILSAKHGLTSPSEVIVPYEQRVSTKKAERQAWAEKVGAEIAEAFSPSTLFVLFAGSDYEAAVQASGRAYFNPMKGLTIGYKRSWLNARLNDEATLF